MKTVLFLLLSLISLTTFGQNGGQSAENSSVKLKQLPGHVNNQIRVIVFNKQSCTAGIRVNTGSSITEYSVSGYDSVTIFVPLSTNKVQAKATTNCGFADFGQVELIINSALPVKFDYITVKKDLSDPFGKTIMVTFKALSTDGEDRFNIQVSTDGINYRTVAVILPDPIVVNQVYNVKIKL